MLEELDELLGEPRAVPAAGKDTQDLQLGVLGGLDAADHVERARHGPDAVLGAELDGDEDPGGGGEAEAGEGAVLGRAVDDDEVVAAGDGSECLAEQGPAGVVGDEVFDHLLLAAAAGQHVEAPGGGDDNVGDGAAVLGGEGQEEGWDGTASGAEARAAGGVGRRVEVDEEDTLAAIMEFSGKLEGGGRLARATLEGSDSDGFHVGLRGVRRC